MSDENMNDSNEQDLPRPGDLLRWAEKTQRTIDFMLEQQARYQAQAEARQAQADADMQSLRDLQRQNEERWARTGGEIRALLAIAEIHEGEIAALAERQAEVGERVDALLNTVEQLISERRSGGGRGEESSG